MAPSAASDSSASFFIVTFDPTRMEHLADVHCSLVLPDFFLEPQLLQTSSAAAHMSSLQTVQLQLPSLIRGLPHCLQRSDVVVGSDMGSV
jgi:hypothetical protein